MCNRSFLTGQGAARLVSARWVNGRFPLFYVMYDSILINGEGGARAVPALFVKDAVIFHHLALEIAQERESHPYVFLEAFVGRVAIDADP